jgi:hypothetical protein
MYILEVRARATIELASEITITEEKCVMNVE